MTFWQQYGATILTISGLGITLFSFHLAQRRAKKKDIKAEQAEKLKEKDEYRQIVKEEIADNATKARLQRSKEDYVHLQMHEQLSNKFDDLKEKNDMQAYGLKVVIQKILGKKVNGELEDFNKIFDKHYIKH